MGKSKTRKNRPKPAHRNSPGGGKAAIKNYARLGKAVAQGSAGNELQIEYQKGQSAGFARTLAVILWVMHQEFGFGRQRLLQLMAETAYLCQEHIAPTKQKVKRNEYHGITVEDIAEQLFEQSGIYINPNGGRIRLAGDKKPYRLDEEGEGQDGE